jgi:hypothetical protein
MLAIEKKIALISRLKSVSFSKQITYCEKLLENPDGSYRGWLLPSFATTSEEINIFNLVKNNKTPIDSLLHVGIGNGELPNFIKVINHLHGITLSSEEMQNSKDTYQVFLINKYNFLEMSQVFRQYQYDVIIDDCIFSYACCWVHAVQYFSFLATHLRSGGVIITGKMGMSYSPTKFLLSDDLLIKLSKSVNLTIFRHNNGVVELRRVEPSLSLTQKT